jgi:hypothetical protein
MQILRRLLAPQNDDYPASFRSLFSPARADMRVLWLTGLAFCGRLAVRCSETEKIYDVYLFLLAPVTFVAELSQFSAGGEVRVNQLLKDLLEKPPLKRRLFYLARVMQWQTWRSQKPLSGGSTPPPRTKWKRGPAATAAGRKPANLNGKHRRFESSRFHQKFFPLWRNLARRDGLRSRYSWWFESTQRDQIQVLS